MRAENAIEVKDVSLRFRRYYDRKYTLKDRIIFHNGNEYEEETVLNRISFEVAKGEALGLIGPNGCGKSSTLKLLTKILYPDEGTIELEGRVSSLLELGAGFHPDLTGRENIFINASVFGLSRREIQGRMEQIIDFSGLDGKIDCPVRTYSSGMYMRLAFSIAIHVDADILLIDEILAVGDVSFQKKCFRKLMEIKQSGVTIVLVSHSAGDIEKICDRSLWIQDGSIREQGRPSEVNKKYVEYMYSKQAGTEPADSEGIDTEPAAAEGIDTEPAAAEGIDTEPAAAEGIDTEPAAAEETLQADPDKQRDDYIRISNVRLTDAEGIEKTGFCTGNELNLEIGIKTDKALCDYNIELNLVNDAGVFCSGISMTEEGRACRRWDGELRFRVKFPELTLLKGCYHFDLHISGDDGETVFFEGNFASFRIESDGGSRGLFTIRYQWDWEQESKDVSD